MLFNLEIIYTPQKNNETVIRENGNVKYITFAAFDIYEDRLANAFSTRYGGVSEGIYSSMNLGLNHADPPENVRANYLAFAKAIGIAPEDIVISDQQHTCNIRITGAKDKGKGLFRERDYEAIDGFITNEKNTALCLLYADCVPVYFYDPVKEAIGLVHSGWKGTCGKISEKAVKMMGDAYGSKPSDIIACIGPSICADCYEVSSDLYDAFEKEFSSDEVESFFLPGKDDDHFQLDLWKAITLTLRNAGVSPENIHVTDICTCHNPNLLFSHRYSKGKRGNLGAFLMLK